jgi:hypothetical protein
LTGPQGEPGTDGEDAVLPPDTGAALSAALDAKTGGDTEPWIVKVSGLDLSDTYIARQIFHAVAEGIPEGDIELDLSECTGEFFGYNAGISVKDKARYTSLTLPASLISISDGKKGTNDTLTSGAFTGFTNLKSVRAAGLLRVGDYAFFMCTNLETLDLPELTGIGDYAFAANSTLTSGNHVNNMALTRVTLPRVQIIGEYAFFRCLAITDLILPEVRRIGNSAFSGVTDASNTLLETVDLPSAEFLDIGAFRYCPVISTIRLPMVQEILGYAFSPVSSTGSGIPNTVLREVELPEASVISGGVFAYCTVLEQADIPVANSIGNKLFWNCAALTTVNAPEATSVGDNAFDGCTSLASLDLPKARSVGVSSFKSCTTLTTLNAPEIADVGNTAFDGCTALASLELAQVRSFGRAVFTNCTALTSLKLGSNVPTRTANANYGLFKGTGASNAAVTVQIPTGSSGDYTTAGWTAATGGNATATWGTDHKEIRIETY